MISNKNIRFRFYIIAAVLAAAVLIHLEVVFAVEYAPEAVLVQVVDEGGVPQEKGECYADIFSENEDVEKRPLRALPSLYEFIDPSSFFASSDRGFFLLETGFKSYRGAFEIRVVCYSDNLAGVSYKIIDSMSRNECAIRNSGKLVVC